MSVKDEDKVKKLFSTFFLFLKESLYCRDEANIINKLYGLVMGRRIQDFYLPEEKRQLDDLINVIFENEVLRNCNVESNIKDFFKAIILLAIIISKLFPNIATFFKANTDLFQQDIFNPIYLKVFSTSDAHITSFFHEIFQPLLTELNLLHLLNKPVSSSLSENEDEDDPFFQSTPFTPTSPDFSTNPQSPTFQGIHGKPTPLTYIPPQLLTKQDTTCGLLYSDVYLDNIDELRKKCKGFTKDRKNLQKVCASAPLSKIKFLIAESFGKLHFHGKTFYIIGENHQQTNPCEEQKGLYIDGLLDSLMRSKTNMYDVFVEMTNYSQPGCALAMQNLFFRFFEDLHFQKFPKRQFRNKLRFHWGDFRDFYLDPLSSLDDLLSIDWKEFFHYLKHKKVRKQFRNIFYEPSKDYYNLIMNYIKTNLQAYRQADDVQEAKKFLFLLNMDLYVIGRMLRDFKDHQSNQIIFYGGYSHAENIYKILTHIGASIEIPYFANTNKACIPFDAERIFD